MGTEPRGEGWELSSDPHILMCGVQPECKLLLLRAGAPVTGNEPSAPQATTQAPNSSPLLPPHTDPNNPKDGYLPSGPNH